MNTVFHSVRRFTLGVFAFIFAVGAISARAQTVSFADTNLEAAVREALSIPSGPISSAEMKGLTNLTANGRSITSLAGLESATELKWLWVEWNPITNHLALSSLTNLIDLSVSATGFTNLALLDPLKRLEFLILYDGRIPDMTPLVWRTNLHGLNLDWCGTTNAWLLSNLVSLTNLWMDGVGLSDISCLSRLTNMSGASLAYSGMTDMSPMTNWPQLSWVNVGENGLTNLPGLSGFAHLSTFMIAGSQISDLSPVTNLPALTELHVQRSRFQSIAPLTNCVGLRTLLLSGNSLTNLGEVGWLSNLTWVDLESMAISNLAFLEPLQALNGIRLNENCLTDLSPLTNLPALNYLELRLNRLQEISPLLEVPALNSVDLSYNYLDTNLVSTAWNVITNLQDRGVGVEYGNQLELPIRPRFTVQPGNVSAYENTTVVFRSAVVEEGGAVSYRWQKDGVDLANDGRINGADTATLQIDNLASADAGSYRVRAWRDWEETNSISGELRMITTVAFADANLELAVRDALGIPSASLTPADMASLGGLDASGRGVLSLDGLEAAANLNWLNLANNPGVSGYGTLSYLSQLGSISVSGCGLHSLQPFSGLSGLTSLEANDNALLTLDGVEGLTNLVMLTAGGNFLTDLAPVAGLDGLSTLYVPWNYLATNTTGANWAIITNLTARGGAVTYDPQHAAPVHPRILGEPGNCACLPGSNVTFSVVVAGGTPSASYRWQKNGVDLADDGRVAGSDTAALWLTNVSAADAGFYRVLVSAPWLSVTSAVVQLRMVTDVGFVDAGLELAVRDSLGIPTAALTTSDLASLTWLDIGGRGITNLAGLEAAVNLNWLRVSDNPGITSFEPLTFLSGLTVLLVDGCNLSDLSGLAGLTRLGEINVARNILSDLSPLARLPGLYCVWADNNQLSQIDPLLELPILGSVSLERNHLDTNLSSAAWGVISALTNRGINVTYLPQYYPAVLPVITKQPESLVCFAGDSAAFHVEATGNEGSLNFRWQKNGANLPDNGRWTGGNNTDLSLEVVAAGDEGDYRVLVWDGYGATNSLVAHLRVISSVSFADTNLEAAVRDQLGIPSGVITPQQIKYLEWLDANDRNLTDLSGMEAAANLLGLNFERSPGITNYAPLASLPRLYHLNLNDCAVASLDFLTNLAALEELHLWGGSFSDLTPLVRHPGLRQLNLGSNPSITNLDILGLLTRMEELSLDSTGLSNVAFAAAMPGLSYLNIWANNVADLTPLTGLTNLQDFSAGYNPITDPAPLAACTNLLYVDLGGDSVTNLSFVGALKQLRNLSVYETQVWDLSPLIGMTNLQWLDVRACQATNVAPLGALTGLTGLSAGVLGVSNWTCLSGLTNLERLYLQQNNLASLPCYPWMRRLGNLSLDGNPLTTIAFVSAMTNLSELRLNNTGIRDLRPMCSCTNLHDLSLAGNGLSDISPLASLSELNWATFWDNNLEDISALSGLNHLSYADLRYNLLNAFNSSPARSVILAQQNRGATVDYDPQKNTAVYLVGLSAAVGGSFGFTVQSAPGAILGLWSSTNLSSWEFRRYLTNSSGSMVLGEAIGTGEAARFYRVLPAE
jgi:internalin A